MQQQNAQAVIVVVSTSFTDSLPSVSLFCPPVDLGKDPKVTEPFLDQKGDKKLTENQ